MHYATVFKEAYDRRRSMVRGPESLERPFAHGSVNRIVNRVSNLKLGFNLQTQSSAPTC